MLYVPRTSLFISIHFLVMYLMVDFDAVYLLFFDIPLLHYCINLSLGDIFFSFDIFIDFLLFAKLIMNCSTILLPIKSPLASAVFELLFLN